jgi:hypothetical protein
MGEGRREVHLAADDIEAVIDFVKERGLKPGEAMVVLIGALWQIFRMQDVGVEQAAGEILEVYRSMRSTRDETLQ